MRAAAVLLMLSSLFMAGCDTEKEKLKKEIAQLKSEQENVAKLKHLLLTRLSEEDRLDRAVFWSQWCDFLIPTCPLSMVKEGREILQKNPSRVVGDGKWMITKVMMLLSAFGTVFLFFFLAWKQLIQPSVEELKASRGEIASAKEESKRILIMAKAEVEREDLELDRLKTETKNAGMALKLLKSNYQELKDHYDGQIDEAEEKLMVIQEQIKASEKQLAQVKADVAVFKNPFK